MIEIGKRRTVVVKTRETGTKKLVPKQDEHGQPVTKLVSDNVYRVTREELGGQFGRDKHRKLVVGLVDGDVLSLRPQGTRQEVAMEIKDLYRYLLRCAAAKKVLEKARQRKITRQAQRERAKIARVDRKLRNSSVKPQDCVQ